MTPHFDQNKFLRLKYTKNCSTARNVFLLSCIATAVSLLLVATLGITFTFSAYMPVAFMEQGKFDYDVDNGVYTADELGISEQALIEYQESIDGTLSLVSSAIPAVIMTACLFLCWALAKKYPVFTIIAAVLYGLDTLLLIPDLISYYLPYDVRSGAFFVIYHAWVLYYLISGSISAAKLKKLPEPIEAVAVELPVEEAVPAEPIVSVAAEEAIALDDTTPEV